jgi:predicted regulator of Ras-like GTPase activity (Roadblock/LC7/MglB family)
MVVMGESSSLLRYSGEKTASMPLPKLEYFLKFGGVQNVLLIRSDGTVITHAGYPEVDSGGLLASISLLIAESGIIAGMIQNGSLSLIFLEFDDKIVLIQEIAYNRYIVIIANSDVNIGQISYHLKKEKLIPVSCT